MFGDSGLPVTIHVAFAALCTGGKVWSGHIIGRRDGKVVKNRLGRLVHTSIHPCQITFAPPAQVNTPTFNVSCHVYRLQWVRHNNQNLAHYKCAVRRIPDPVCSHTKLTEYSSVSTNVLALPCQCLEHSRWQLVSNQSGKDHQILRLLQQLVCKNLAHRIIELSRE